MAVPHTSTSSFVFAQSGINATLFFMFLLILPSLGSLIQGLRPHDRSCLNYSLHILLVLIGMKSGLLMEYYLPSLGKKASMFHLLYLNLVFFMFQSLLLTCRPLVVLLMVSIVLLLFFLQIVFFNTWLRRVQLPMVVKLDFICFNTFYISI